MSWISFDALRTLGFTDTRYLKPEQLFAERELIKSAEWVLFPEYWQLGALVHGYKSRIFPSPASYLLGHDKIEMTRAFMSVVPQHVPQTLICGNTPSRAEALWDEMGLPFVAKLPRSSQGQGVWLVENRAQWTQYLAFTDVLYVQELLPIDRDLRIVVIGGRVVDAYWRLQSPDGFHNNVSRGGSISYDQVTQNAIDLALHVAATLGIDHAGFDIAMVGQHPYLLEFNRLFGNSGIRGGDAVVHEAIVQYLRSHSKPMNPGTPRTPLRPGTGNRRLRRAA